MTTTNIKCLQSRDIDAISNETPCVIIGGSSTKETAVGGDTAQDARDAARESGAYGCEVSTVGEWARTAPEKQAYVLEDRGDKDGPVWWLSTVQVTILVDQENGAEEWWDAARDAGATDVPDALIPLLCDDATDNEVTVDGEDAAAALAWAATLPGWSEGPAYAPHPLLTR
jgi:hypothetical protein